MLAKINIDGGQVSQGPDAGRSGRADACGGGSNAGIIFQAFNLTGHARTSGLAQQGRSGAVGGQGHASGVHTEQHLAGRSHHRNALCRELFPDSLQLQRLHGTARLRQTLRSKARLACQFVNLGVQRAAAQVQACVKRALYFDVKPAFDAA